MYAAKVSAQMDLQIQEMVDQQFLVLNPFDSGFLSTIFLVPKSDGFLRPIVNLKRLNTFLTPRKFHLLNHFRIPDFLQRNDFLMKIDLSQAYFHVPSRFVLETLAQLGWTVNFEKPVLNPVHTLQYLGIHRMEPIPRLKISSHRKAEYYCQSSPRVSSSGVMVMEESREWRPIPRAFSSTMNMNTLIERYPEIREELGSLFSDESVYAQPAPTGQKRKEKQQPSKPRVTKPGISQGSNPAKTSKMFKARKSSR
ncbi:hypothetical protein M8J77_025921 [Diaphorina citri]|nr:hypothetical protein M8J77_025921 [Diaphorina citri]